MTSKLKQLLAIYITQVTANYFKETTMAFKDNQTVHFLTQNIQ